MAEKVLLFDGPKSFLTYPRFIYNKLKGYPLDNKYNTLNAEINYNAHQQKKLRYTTRGANEVCNHCVDLGYETTHFDYDARLIKKFGNIAQYLNNLLYYFDDENFDFNYVDELHETFFSEFDYKDDYDYLLCSLQMETSRCDYITKLQVKFSLLLLNYLKKNNPKLKIILGGNICNYPNFKNSYINEIYSNIEIPFIDKIVRGKVNLDSIKLLLTENKHEDDPKSYFSDYDDLKPYNPIPISNIEDIRYTYKFIFNHYGFDIPDTLYSKSYIQQAEIKFVLGCSGVCAFCISSKKVEILSYDKMKDLMMSYIDQGYNSFFIMDDAINPIAERFCNWVIKNNLDIHWSNDTKHSLDKSYYEMLFEAGCNILYFGVESFNDNTLKYIRKGITKEKILQSLRYSHNSNIWNGVNMIVDLPYSKLEDDISNQEIILENEDIINELLMYKFKFLESSPFHDTPNKFKLRYVSTKGPNGFFIWKETYGKSWSDVVDDMSRNSYPTQLINKPYLFEVPQHLLFALYGIFKTKDKVMNWMTDNYYKKMENIYDDRLYRSSSD